MTPGDRNAASLTGRWHSRGGRELARAVQDRIVRNEALDDLRLPVIDGRIDLRHLPFPARIRELSGVRLRNIDLSGSMLANLRIIDSLIDDCLFVSANCRHWHLRGSLVTGCSFAGADMRDSTLGEWFEGRGNTYRRIAFTSARLRRSTTSAAVYEDCDFSFAELDRINFWQSSLTRCRFAGPLRDVVFDGRLLGEGKPMSNPMDGVNLTAAILDGCEFRGVNLDAVLLPDDPALVRIPDATSVDSALAALARVGAHPHAPLAEAVLHHVRQDLVLGGETLLNLRDIEPASELVSQLLQEVG